MDNEIEILEKSYNNNIIGLIEYKKTDTMYLIVLEVAINFIIIVLHIWFKSSCKKIWKSKIAYRFMYLNFKINILRIILFTWK